MIPSNPKLVVIGGGTGAPQLLAGFRSALPEATASIIVPVTDTGRSTGVVRRMLGIPAPGDVRHCLTALADESNPWAEVLERRLSAEESSGLDGMAVGNLVLGSLAQSKGDIGAAALKLGKLLGVPERVLPVSIEDIQLAATLEDGTRVFGELEIRRPGKARISGVSVVGGEVGAWQPAGDALIEADVVVLGPGSLWTSIGAVLSVPGTKESMANSFARIVFVCNTTTQPGQTDGLGVRDHVEVITKLLGRRPDIVILNTQAPSAGERDALAKEGLDLLLPTNVDLQWFKGSGIKVSAQPLLGSGEGSTPLWNKVRTAYHDPERTARVIGDMIGSY